MNDKDLIRALRGMTMMSFQFACLGCGHEHSCSVHGCAIIKEAAARLEGITEPSNDPLTLDELREMDGEPVFIIHNEYGKGWCIIDWHGVNKSWFYFSKTGTVEGMTAVPVTAATYGETWLAFRRKPEDLNAVLQRESCRTSQ